MTRKNVFLTFCFACIPGAGQMYLGYMKRGLSLMGLFAGVCGIMMLVQVGALGVVLPVLFAYSFFDTFRLRNQLPGQETADDYLLHVESFAGAGWQKMVQSRSKLLGWGCIALAIILMWNDFVRPIVQILCEQFDNWILYNILHSLPVLAVALLLVWLGVRLLRKTPGTAAEAEFVAFQGQSEEEQLHE